MAGGVKLLVYFVPWTCRSLDLRWVQIHERSTETNTTMHRFQVRLRRVMVMNRDIHIINARLIEKVSELKKLIFF